MKTRLRWLRWVNRLAKACFFLLLANIAGLWIWGGYSKAIPHIVIPSPPLPHPNAYDDYAAAFQLFTPRPHHVGEGIFSGYAGGPNVAFYTGTGAQKAAVLRDTARTLAGIRRGFIHAFRQPPTRSFYSQQQQRYGDLSRQMARAFVVESQLRGAEGDWRGAADSTLDAMHLGYDFPRGGCFPAPMVGWAIRTIGANELWQVLPHLDASQAREAARRLERLRAREVSFSESLREEKWALQGSLLELMRDENWDQAHFSQMEPRERFFRRIFLNYRVVLQNNTRLMDAQIAEAQRPYPQQTPVAPLTPSLQDPINTLLAPPIYGRTSATSFRTSANDALLLTALALHAYHLEQGHYPPSLSALVPRYLQRVPADPFGNGEALRYRPQSWKYQSDEIWPPPLPLPLGLISPGSVDYPRLGPPAPIWTTRAYTLYSIGPDARDNGGRPTDNAHRNGNRRDIRRWRVESDSRGDMIAGLNR